MFVKYLNLFLNLERVHLKLDNNALILYEKSCDKPVHVLKFSDNRIASFAYGRVIHATLLHWEAVDVTETAIVKLMDSFNCNSERSEETETIERS